MLDAARKGDLSIRARCAVALRHAREDLDDMSPEAAVGALLEAERDFDLHALRLAFEEVHRG